MLIIKTFSTVPDKRVFYLWASYDGDSIVSEPAVAPLFSNSIYTATHQKISYGKNISSFLKGKDAKALNRIFFFYEQSPQPTVFLYDILLQRCRKASWKILLASLHSSPLCFTLNYKASLSLTGFFPKTSQTLWLRYTECEYAHPKIRKPIGLVERDSMLKNLSKFKFDRCCRRIKAGIQHYLFVEEQFENQNSIFSSKVFCDSEKEVFSQAKDIQQERKS